MSSFVSSSGNKEESGINPYNYYWKRKSYIYETLPSLSSFTAIGSDYGMIVGYVSTSDSSRYCNVTIEVSDTLSIDSATGEILLVDPVEVTVGSVLENYNTVSMANKYFKLKSYELTASYIHGSYANPQILYNNPNRIWYTTSNFTSTTSGGYRIYRLYYNGGDYPTYYVLSSGFIYDNPTYYDDEIVVSSDIKNTYPNNSQFDVISSYYPYAYKYVGCGLDMQASWVKIDEISVDIDTTSTSYISNLTNYDLTDYKQIRIDLDLDWTRVVTSTSVSPTFAFRTFSYSDSTYTSTSTIASFSYSSQRVNATNNYNLSMMSSYKSTSNKFYFTTPNTSDGGVAVDGFMFTSGNSCQHKESGIVSIYGLYQE